MFSRADLHVHSKYSNRPSEWLLQRLGVPECYTEPAEVYDLCRKNGMDFVTITDHNSIEGPLEIAHLPNTFVSNEVTTYFPEDGCKVHVLVFGINESQFRDIQRLRRSIYDFRDYLFDNDIAYSVAHPLYAVNDRLTVEHFERLIVLFKHFEAINGARKPTAGVLVRAILGNLTPRLVADFANQYDIDPRDDRPWNKVFTAGSDDHSALHIARAYTMTPVATNTGEFLERLRSGDHSPAGASGSSLTMARSFYAIAYSYYRDRTLGRGDRGREPFDEVLKRLLQEGAVEASLPLNGNGEAKRHKSFFGGGRNGNLAILKQLAGVKVKSNALASPDVRCFDTASAIGQKMASKAIKKAVTKVRKGKFNEAAQSLSGLGTVGLAVAPYLAAFYSQHKDDLRLEAVARRFRSARLLRRRPQRALWFTDTLGQVNGVARTVVESTQRARDKGFEVEVIGCSANGEDFDKPIHLFEPVTSFKMPEYADLQVAIPPFLEVLEHCERRQASEVIISTPGPVGLLGLAVGRLFSLPVTGIYHTDFPLYLRYLTGSGVLETLAWTYMRWFFGHMDRLFMPSRATMQQLESHGVDASSMSLFRRSVDLNRFHPARRRTDFWDRFGLNDAPKVAYVGRVSKEKNLEALLNAFVKIRARGRDCQLAIVGDGPDRQRLEDLYGERPDIAFTGFLSGDELVEAYASADLFAFPSLSDTYGNAVLEAQASGLPAVVSNLGGPQEIIDPGRSGVVFDAADPEGLICALTDLLADPLTRARMSRAAREVAEGHGDEVFFDDLWSDEEMEARDRALDRFDRIDRSEPAMVVASGF